MNPTVSPHFPRLSCISVPHSLQNRNSVLTVIPAPLYFTLTELSSLESSISVMARSAVAMAVAMVVVVVAMAAMVPPANAVCDNIRNMLPCMAAARDGVQPTPACCSAVTSYAKGGTVEGEACLCQAVTNPLAKQAGMKLNYAILIPQKCNLNYKAGYKCNGQLIPGGHA